MDLLNLCLTSTYFQYNGNNYKLQTTNSYTEQLWARQSPLLLQTEIVMQNIEEQALSTYNKTLPLWLSPTVLFRTTLTRTITLDKLLILLGSNHLLCLVYVRAKGTIRTFNFFLFIQHAVCVEDIMNDLVLYIL